MRANECERFSIECFLRNFDLKQVSQLKQPSNVYLQRYFFLNKEKIQNRINTSMQLNNYKIVKCLMHCKATKITWNR